MAQLREWLEARGLGRYADALLAHDIELDILPLLTDADLTAAGLPIGRASACSRRLRGFAMTKPRRCRQYRSPPFRQPSRQLGRSDGS
jgi:SAM domain (Sterile alpha motif)